LDAHAGCSLKEAHLLLKESVLSILTPFFVPRDKFRLANPSIDKINTVMFSKATHAIESRQLFPVAGRTISEIMGAKMYRGFTFETASYSREKA
jgi:hypothetical protein